MRVKDGLQLVIFPALFIVEMFQIDLNYLDLNWSDAIMENQKNFPIWRGINSQGMNHCFQIKQIRASSPTMILFDNIVQPSEMLIISRFKASTPAKRPKVKHKVWDHLQKLASKVQKCNSLRCWISKLTSYLWNRVVSAVYGGSGGTVDEERKMPLILVLYYQLLQLFRDHLTPVNTTLLVSGLSRS